MQTFDKQPRDQLDYDVGYGDWLPDGDTILTAEATFERLGVELDPGIEDTFAIVAVHVNSPTVKVWVEGGISRVSYKVTVIVSTAGGRVKETEFRVRVKEK